MQRNSPEKRSEQTEPAPDSNRSKRKETVLRKMGVLASMKNCRRSTTHARDGIISRGRLALIVCAGRCGHGGLRVARAPHLEEGGADANGVVDMCCDDRCPWHDCCRRKVQWPMGGHFGWKVVGGAAEHRWMGIQVPWMVWRSSTLVVRRVGLHE